MDLRTYTENLPRGGMSALAEQLGITTVYLSQLAARQNEREPSPVLCVRLEQLTNGIVTRKDLRPDDWAAIWPELASSVKQEA